MKTKPPIAVTILVSIFVFLLASGAHSQPKATSSVIPKGDPIKVGVFCDLTGQTSSFGIATEKGVRLAAEEINRAGGINGRSIEVVVSDDQGIPSGAVTTALALIQEEHVIALIGEIASTNSLAVAPRAQEARIPMISPGSTNPKITQVGDYIFRTAFIDPLQGWAMARFARESLHAKTAAVFGDVNSDYSKYLTQHFKEEFTRTGGQMVAETGYTQDDLEFRAQLRAIRQARPDVIYVPGYYPQAGRIIRQARQLGMRQPILGGDGWVSPELFKLGGNALPNTYMSDHYATDDPSPAVRNFVARYQRRYNEPPNVVAPLAYDTMNLLAEALRRAGTTERSKLRDAIAQTRNFRGVTGDITLDADRNPIKPVIILRYREGKYMYRERVLPVSPN